MADDTLLRQQARAATRDGRLPNRRPDRQWGGHGCGARCPACERQISPRELEVELEYAQQREGPGVATFHLHVACLHAWEAEVSR
jgi:hypothetical protein